MEEGNILKTKSRDTMAINNPVYRMASQIVPQVDPSPRIKHIKACDGRDSRQVKKQSKPTNGLGFLRALGGVAVESR